MVTTLIYIAATASYGIVALWCVHHAHRFPARRSPLIGCGIYFMTVTLRAGLTGAYPESSLWPWNLVHGFVIITVAGLVLGDLVFGRKAAAILVALLLAGCISGGPPPLPTARQPIYLPLVSQEQPCANGSIADMKQFLVRDSRQKHPLLICEPALMAAARERALDLAQRGYFAHKNPDGVWPNAIARQHGCKLPASYPDDGNTIESIVAGVLPAAGWIALTNSPSHADHLLGRTTFYREQTHYGMAQVTMPGSPYTYYQVYLIGVCE